MVKPEKQVIQRQVYEPFDFKVAVYDLGCEPSVNPWLVKRAYTLDKFSQENTVVFK